MNQFFAGTCGGGAPEYDRDADMIANKFEFYLAKHFRPIYWCYDDDDSCTGSEAYPEPQVLYQVSPIDSSTDFSPILSPESRDPEYVYLAITYTMLWSRDGGLGEFPYSRRPELYCCTMGCMLHPIPIPPGDPGVCIFLCLEDAWPSNIYRECQCLWALDPLLPGDPAWHFGDVNFLRIFVRSRTTDLRSWEIFGLQNDDFSKVAPDDLSRCVDFSPGFEGGCHPNLYLSFGKKHQYLGPGLIESNDCSGDWLPSVVDDCLELIDPARMTSRIADIGSWEGYWGAHDRNVGSYYEHLMGTLQYMNPDWEEEWAWDDRNFCGSGVRRSGAFVDDLCCADYDCSTEGPYCCNLFLLFESSSPVGSKWLKERQDVDPRDVDYDMDSRARNDLCPLINDDLFGGADSDMDGWGDPCDNCPADSNECQEDSDADGVGDACDLCPNDERIAESYHHVYPDDNRLGDKDHDRLANTCDLCPDLDYTMAGGRVEHGYVPLETRFIDSAGSLRSQNDDSDHFGDRCDNCRYVSNWQVDSDGDTIGDDCDLCPEPWQNPEHIGTSDYPFWSAEASARFLFESAIQDICNYVDCTGVEPGREIVFLDSEDEAAFYGPLRQFNDLDGDGVGDLCDNCWYIPNANQKNCNEDWELETRDDEMYPLYSDEDIEGDACDPEPCVKIEYYPEVIPGIYRVQGNWAVVANEDPCHIDCDELGEPLHLGCEMPPDEVYYAYAAFTLDNHGHNDGPGLDNPLQRPVMNAWCNCTQGYYVTGDTEACESDPSTNCGEYGYVTTNDSGAGWYSMSRIAVTNEQIYPERPAGGYPVQDGNFPHDFERDYCGNYLDPTRWSCYLSPTKDGCFESDPSDCPGTLYLYWDYIRDLGKEFVSGYPRYFFKPDDESFTGDLILKNADYTDRIVAMGLPSCPTIPPRPVTGRPGWYNYAAPLPYMPVVGKDDPSLVRLGDSILIQFPYWLDPPVAGEWHYETVRDTSALQGIGIERRRSSSIPRTAASSSGEEKGKEGPWATCGPSTCRVSPGRRSPWSE